MRFTALVLGLLFVSGAAWAEQGCPDGFIPNGAGTPGVPCIPGPASSGGDISPPQQPIVHWEKRWGAIAGDSETGKTGVAGSMSSKRRAEKEALAHCRAKGGGNCKVLTAFSNQCGAMAWGGGYMVTANAPTLEEASDLAVANCQKGGTADCKVYFSNCSYAEQAQ